jgi:hypothetical protein
MEMVFYSACGLTYRAASTGATEMKKLLYWGTVGLLTTALLDPLIYSMLDKPIPWIRDLLMGGGGATCFYILIKYRNDL